MPVGHGWGLTECGQLQHVHMTQSPVPEALLGLSRCGCTTSKCTKNCKCSKGQLGCTEACTCQNSEECQNTFKDNESDDDSDKEIGDWEGVLIS